MAKIALADDHAVTRLGLSMLIESLGHEVLFEAASGQDVLTAITGGLQPDVVLMDINMPLMDGYETTEWLNKNHPEIHVLALTMNDSEHAIIKMLRCGAKGYIIKDCQPIEVKQAIEAIVQHGFYYSDLVNGKLAHSTANPSQHPTAGAPVLNPKETTFLKFTCSELTYKEIADKMCVSPRTV